MRQAPGPGQLSDFGKRPAVDRPGPCQLPAIMQAGPRQGWKIILVDRQDIGSEILHFLTVPIGHGHFDQGIASVAATGRDPFRAVIGKTR